MVLFFSYVSGQFPINNQLHVLFTFGFYLIAYFFVTVLP